MTIASQLRARARRYRELAQIHQGDVGEGLRQAAVQLEHQADALEAYAAAARLTDPRALTLHA